MFQDDHLDFFNWLSLPQPILDHNWCHLCHHTPLQLFHHSAKEQKEAILRYLFHQEDGERNGPPKKKVCCCFFCTTTLKLPISHSSTAIVKMCAQQLKS